jgi:hypothetical protein
LLNPSPRALVSELRPETHPIKKLVGFTEEMIAAVETWRAKQKPVPNLSEAIRQLVEIGLKAKGKRAG